MFCPVCRDEYRSGFTQCGTCDVALVETLQATAPPPKAPVLAETHVEEAATGNFCGFLTLDEAQEARRKVRAARLPAEILIKDAPKASPDAPQQDEFWLRVRPADFAAVVALIGFEPADTVAGEETFSCSACGETAHSSDEACPGCGLRFEE